MSIVLINRNDNAGFSIYKCFSEFKNYLNVKELFVPEYRVSLRNLYRNISHIRKNTNRDDILHITGDIHYVLLGLIGRNTILTIHDTVLLDRTKKSFKWFVYYLFWFFLPCKIAKKIVCISEETNRRLQQYVKCNTVVISDPVSSIFIEKEKIFNSECPAILHIGTGWNKNLLNVIAAVSGMNIKLIIIGKVDDELFKNLVACKIEYEIKEKLSDEQILEEYSKCDIVSFPTIYEGFGLPILEGQAIGRVVITSNIEPHISVAGVNGAIFVNPYDIKSIKQGFEIAINNDKLRNEIINNGLKNVINFSAEKVTMKYKRIYEEVVN